MFGLILAIVFVVIAVGAIVRGIRMNDQETSAIGEYVESVNKKIAEEKAAANRSPFAGPKYDPHFPR